MKRNKIKDVFIKVFEYTDKLGSQMIYISQNKRCFVNILVILVFVILAISSLFINEINPFLVMFLIISLFVVLFISNANKILISVWGFMTTGTSFWYIIGVFIYLTFSKMISVTSNLIMYIIFATVWLIYSLIANNEVATLANQIHSTILALVVLSKDIILASIPTSILEQVETGGETVESIINKVFLSILSPLLAVNLIALLFCIIKGYWIKKYNNNKDVGQDGMDVKYEIEKLKEQNKQMSEQIDQLKEQIKTGNK